MRADPESQDTFVIPETEGAASFRDAHRAPAAFDRLHGLAQAGVPVVCCAGTPSGPVAAQAWYPGAYEAFTRAGLILEDRLSPRKARLRLMLGLALGLGYVPVRVEENLAH